ncbi:MAG TPA: ATP-grasp domain-containing protein [Methylophilaceae bacterium]|nr:ATP-grasp domain-containing protein [Methylophilaceae bacterium]
MVAADAFCDADTRQAAAQVVQLGYARGGFDAEDFGKKLFPLLSQSGGFVYGSGFETRPQLLEEIAQLCPVLGNTAQTVGITKDPGRFFPLLSLLGLPFPEISLTLPAATEGWLSKRIGGSGGTHVMPAMQADDSGGYYQRLVPGKPCSLLFLADGKRARAVGYNAQLLAPAPGMPYRYGGVVSQAELPESVRKGLLQTAQQLTMELELRGLNSLDCMVDGDGFVVLEINPRLSASFALYDAENRGARLFEAHLRACAGQLPADFPAEPAQAHLIYYAPFDLAIPVALAWPQWVADIPPGVTRIKAGEPVCTVMAVAATTHEAMALARTRVAELTQRIT